MYISIKLPPEFGSFNKLRMENYPFNKLFTSYLAAVSRLGMSMSMDVDALVGYIEDRVFDGMRLPDIPDGDEPVNLRYKTDNPDVMKYIGDSSLTNRMAVMYIARMTLRMSVTYGTSLFRLTRLIEDLSQEGTKKQPKREPKKDTAPPKPRARHVEEQAEEAAETAPPMPKVRLSARAQEAPMQSETPAAAVSQSAQAAKEALSELQELTGQALGSREPEEEETAGEGVMQTNPLLSDFGI